MVDLVLPRATGEDPVRLELQAPVVLGGELADRSLAFEHLAASGGLQQPRREQRAPVWGGAGAEPLEERRATKEIQIEGVRVIGQIDASGSVAVGQGVPVAGTPR